MQSTTAHRDTCKLADFQRLVSRIRQQRSAIAGRPDASRFPSKGMHSPRQARFFVCSSLEDEGVRALLKRDRKDVDLEAEAAFQDNPPEKAAEPTPAPSSQSAPSESKREQQAEASTSESAIPDGPRKAGEAIALGIEKLQGGDPRAAIDLFQRALELPGNGAYRLAGTPKEYSCASEGEEIAALYNLACAYCALGQRDAALASLEGAIETGFKDFDALRSDPDLAPLRGPGLEILLAKAKGQGFLSSLNPFQKKK